MENIDIINRALYYYKKMVNDNTLECLPIVMINYNGDQDTIECIDSLLRSYDQNFQVIVVDNSPSTESLEKISKWGKKELIPSFYKGEEYIYPFKTSGLELNIIAANEIEASKHLLNSKVLIIRSQVNEGFAAANNIGLQLLLKFKLFKWVWLLNNDTIVPPNVVTTLRNKLMTFPDTVGMVGTKIYYYHTPTILQGVAGNYNPLFSTTGHVGAHKSEYDYTSASFKKAADFIMGASMLVRQEFIKDVGLMDEGYFLYYEELDWALRGKAQGWELDLVPEAYILHKEGASISRNMKGVSLLADKCSVVNRIKITRKYFPSKIAIVYLSLLNVFYRRIKRGQSNRIYPIIKAIYKNNPL
jgi:GT2 family glycosyltransferase